MEFEQTGKRRKERDENLKRDAALLMFLEDGVNKRGVRCENCLTCGYVGAIYKHKIILHAEKNVAKWYCKRCTSLTSIENLNELTNMFFEQNPQMPRQ